MAQTTKLVPWAVALAVAAGAAGCTSRTGPATVAQTGVEAVRLEGPQTVPGIGAGQGAAVHDGFVYLYGDAGTGVIREYRSVTTPDGRGRLDYTGREVRLTRDGEDLIPHPTGLTFHPEHGTFLGNTVAGKGTIFHLDWEAALADGRLDRAVLNAAQDDLAVNGCRPEYVEVDGRWLIATADYGAEDNAIRLCDPVMLARVDRTSRPGVLIRQYRCGPFVQSLCWVDQAKRLVLAQNQVAGLRYRLSVVRLDGPQDVRGSPAVDLDHPRDELEGFVMIGEGRCLLVSSSWSDNVWFAEIDLDALEGDAD